MLVQQQFRRLVQGRGQVRAVEERAGTRQGQQHHVVDIQARQAQERLFRHVRAAGPEAIGPLHHAVHVLVAADAPEQGIGL